jgi:hypothetical protein
VPSTTIVEIPPAEQAHMVAEIRRARYGYLLALHILLLCAAQRTPTELAALLFCSRSTVYRVVRAHRAGQWEELGGAAEAGRASSPWSPTVLAPALKRTVLTMLNPVPRGCVCWLSLWSLAKIEL